MSVCDWLERNSNDQVRTLADDLSERQAIVDQNLAKRTGSDLDLLERAAKSCLDRDERFRGEHYCARTLLSVDIPRWRGELYYQGRHFRKIAR